MGARDRPSLDPSFGALLRELREEASLTQEALAARSGLSANAISMLERGVRRSPRRSTVDLLSRALRLDTEKAGALWRATRTAAEQAAEVDEPDDLAKALAVLASLPVDASPPHAPLPAGPRMPIAPNPLFIGRGEELVRVAAALRGGDATVALGQMVASTGLGGLGKTQLAVELVHRYGRFFAGGVFWLSFASAEEIPLQVAACAGSGAAGLETDVSSRPLEDRVKLVQSAWQSAVPRLLVFDNCEEESLLERWRPTSGGCRVLLTSRRSHWSPTLGVTALPLDLLPRPDSIELLRRYRPDLAAADTRLDAIAEKLGDLPLALHLAGRYLLAYRAEVGLDDYLAELDRPELVGHASLLGEDLDDSPSPTHHVQSLAQTFALSLSRLDGEREVDRVAIALLARMACLAPGEAVPRDLLGRALADVAPRRRAAGLRRLAATGLVEDGDGWLRLHRLLAHFVRREDLDSRARAAVDRTLVESGMAAWEGQLTGAALAAVVPHLVNAASGDAGDDLRQAALCNAAGVALGNAGDLRAAGPWLERGLSIRERALGPDHPDTATSLNALAGLLWKQGQLPRARALLVRAAAIRERALGAGHLDTAESLNDLALVLWNQGDLASARTLLHRVLGVRQLVLGADHLLVAQSVNNLGLVLWEQGQLPDARDLFERALAITEGSLGAGHPYVAHCLNNLGLVLQDRGELDAARSRFERGLEISERQLGPDHPQTALRLNNLGRLLVVQGELDAARPLHQRALRIRERVLGADHPDTAQSLGNLARLLHAQGEPDAARPLQERALAIRERALGPDHPDTAVAVNDLARALRARGDLDAARPLHERALAVWERRLGPEHPRTAAGLHDLGTLLRCQGDLAAARRFLERSLVIRQRVLGPGHPDTAATRRALAELPGEG